MVQILPFRWKYIFLFHLEIKLLESGGRVEMHKVQDLWRPVWGFRSIWWFGVSTAGLGPLCFIKSNVKAIYQEILEQLLLLWAIVERKMRNTRPKNTDELKATIEATWASVTPQLCHRQIASITCRIDAVIGGKGVPTKYWVYKWINFSEVGHFRIVVNENSNQN